MIKKRSLGKGLEALFEEHLKGKEDVFVLDVSKIRVNKEQPRKSFNIETLSSLADSIKRNGVIQPIVVRKIDDKNRRQNIVSLTSKGKQTLKKSFEILNKWEDEIYNNINIEKELLQEVLKNIAINTIELNNKDE